MTFLNLISRIRYLIRYGSQFMKEERELFLILVDRKDSLTVSNEWNSDTRQYCLTIKEPDGSIFAEYDQTYDRCMSFKYPLPNELTMEFYWWACKELELNQIERKKREADARALERKQFLNWVITAIKNPKVNDEFKEVTEISVEMLDKGKEISKLTKEVIDLRKKALSLNR